MARGGLLLAAAAVAAVTVSVWPACSVAVAVVGVALVLAVADPAAAFVFGVVAFLFEGSLKAALAAEANPLGIAPHELGAAAVDLAFAIGLAAAAVAYLSDARALWRALPGLARLGAALLALWILLSVVQALFSPSLRDAAYGLRLTQFYALAAVGGALVAARARPRMLPLLLAGCTVAAAYAAVRFLAGPSPAERDYALSRVSGVPEYGDVFRTVGSFSSSVALNSFLVPAAVLALALLVLEPRARVASAALLAAATIGMLGTYGRGALVAFAVAALAVAAVVAARRDVGLQRKLVVVLGVVVLVATDAAAAWVLAEAAPATRERSEALVDPLEDRSARLRVATWGDAVETIGESPLGTGIGTVGHASGDDDAATTDNSFLKVFVEQGLLGGLLFLLGLGAVLAALARELVRLPRADAGARVGAWAAVLGFLVLAATGEYVEQPGKVLVWALLGVACAAVAAREAAPASTWRPPRAVWAIAAATLLVAVPPAFAALRDHEFEASTGVAAAAEPGRAGLIDDVRVLATNRSLLHNAIAETGLAVDDLTLRGRVTVTADGAGRARIGVRFTSPERAETLVSHVASRVVRAAARAAAPASAPLRLAGGTSTEPPSRLLDRAIDALPGDLPPAPGPGWAFVAGALVATGAAAALSLRRRPPEVRGSRAPRR